ncbi:MAG: 4Fe-4S binding protein, partial [Desulfobacteraceae bacterium]|nr:4Fe-4S binding protein [Desulfobacteraceae bacterium]
LEVLFKFLVFLVLVSVLSKIWCGWICPFCTFQDWITLLRKKLHVREAEFSQATRKSLKSIKYILLAYLVIVPVLVTNAGLHSDFSLPFCQICPAKPIMPLFVLETKYLSLNFTNAITLTFSILSIVIAAGMLVGMFFKERFFCMICPMLALIHIFKRISFIKFHKSPATCVSCGNCHRMCPVDIPDVSREKKNRDVMGEDCMLCMKCVESCPENNVLTVKFLNFRIFSSSQKYVAKYFK